MKQSRFELLFLLGAMTAFAPLTVDMYLPAMPMIQESLGVDEGAVQRTLTSYFIGFAISQFLYGPLVDAFGRKRPLYAGMGIYVLVSAGCALASDIGALTWLRFFQAAGSCSGVVIARAMVRDLFEPEETARVFSLLMLVVGLAPMLAPLAGGYLAVWFGWRSVFWALALMGMVCLAGAHFRLRETQDRAFRRSITMRGIVEANGELLADRRFLVNTLIASIGMAGLFAYVVSAPFVFINLYGVATEHFGWILTVNALGFVGVAQVNARLIRAGNTLGIMRGASVVQCVAGAAVVAAAVTGAGGLGGLLVPLFVYISCLGLLMPNSTSMAMAPYRHIGGAASALLGTTQSCVAAGATGLLSAVGAETARPMAVAMMCCGAAGLVLSLLQPGGAGGGPAGKG